MTSQTLGRIIVQLVGSLVTTALCATPILIIILVRWLCQPQGFWQNALVYGLGFYFLAGIQVLLFILWVCSLIFIWAVDLD